MSDKELLKYWKEIAEAQQQIIDVLTKVNKELLKDLL